MSCKLCGAKFVCNNGMSFTTCNCAREKPDELRQAQAKSNLSHNFILMSSHGEDSEGKSLSTYLYCPKCGSVKYDYRHNVGQMSPNFPMYLGIGSISWGMTEPKCSSN